MSMRPRIDLDPEVLADAILVGCDIFPRQAFRLLGGWEGGSSACALGALGAGLRAKNLQDHYVAAKNAQVINPVSERLDFFGMVIIDLNDRIRWRREQVAAWVRTLRYDKDKNMFYDPESVLELPVVFDPLKRKKESWLLQ